MDDVKNEIATALSRFGACVHSRDMAVLDQFADDAEIMFIGSEPAEIDRGKPALQAHMERIFALPVRIGWDWRTLDAFCSGDCLWFFAEGDAVLTGPDRQTRQPYRLSGVLVRSGPQLRWRLFHGSEPAG